MKPVGSGPETRRRRESGIGCLRFQPARREFGAPSGDSMWKCRGNAEGPTGERAPGRPLSGMPFGRIAGKVAGNRDVSRRKTKGPGGRDIPSPAQTFGPVTLLARSNFWPGQTPDPVTGRCHRTWSGDVCGRRGGRGVSSVCIRGRVCGGPWPTQSHLRCGVPGRRRVL